MAPSQLLAILNATQRLHLMKLTPPTRGTLYQLFRRTQSTNTQLCHMFWRINGVTASHRHPLALIPNANARLRNFSLNHHLMPRKPCSDIMEIAWIKLDDISYSWWENDLHPTVVCTWIWSWSKAFTWNFVDVNKSQLGAWPCVSSSLVCHFTWRKVSPNML
jgi:hypothetical protein